MLLAAWFVLGYLGALLHPPDWLRQLSPFTHTPEVPVAGVALAGPASIALLSCCWSASGWSACAGATSSDVTCGGWPGGRKYLARVMS